MTTPAIMLGLLVTPWLATVLLRGRRRSSADARRLAGCIGILLLFSFTGIGHFVQAEPMAAMLPGWVPARVPLVYATGVLEIAAAIAVVIPWSRRLTGWGLIVMLVLFLPTNVYAALHRVGPGGHQWGPVYLWLRVPLQLILIAWIWWFAVRQTPPIDSESTANVSVT